MSPHDAFLTEHDQIWELLPWYVNGTLDAPEHERVERHVRTCLPCHTELARQRELASLVQAPESLPLSPARGLARLEERLATHPGPRPAPRRARWGRLALAEAALILLLLGVVLLRSRPPALPAPPFETLSDAPAAVERASGPVFRVLFVENAPERELRELLASLELRVIDGPSPIGLFTVETSSRADAGAVLARLREHRAVRFAERIDLPSGAQGD